MALRRQQGKGCAALALALALRLLVASLLPLLVAALRPPGSDGRLLLIAATALGLALSAVVARLQYLLLLTTGLACVMVSFAHAQGLHFAAAGEAMHRVQLAVNATRKGEEKRDWVGVPLETMSVVLPCAFEGNYAEKTVESLRKHTKLSRLFEIIVVDDGSQPPLKDVFPEKLRLEKPEVRILRHEKTLGLIAAKKTGGDAARGDVIVFFDCHIAPRDGWEEAFLRQMKRAGDHRTVVVPTITSLDMDTWKEVEKGGSQGRACYFLWNADFTWLANPGRDVPLMSGGLLALSRRWWEETGGYDEHMVAWGGENIDQSIRIWLCGGRIEVAEGAFVAHMWRDAKNPKTRLKYPIPTKDVMRNKARAVQAWFGSFAEKAMSFPEYEQFTKYHESLGDMSGFDVLKARLGCRPFVDYLQRFSYVYLDTGLIPKEVFQIREARSHRCLERSPLEAPPHGLILAPCSGGQGGGPTSELQLWHTGNRDQRRPGKPCCSGLMNWNFLHCLDAQAVGSRVKTFACEISGGAANQFFALGDNNGLLLWRPDLKRQKGEACVVPQEPRLGDAVFGKGLTCVPRVVALDGGEFRPPGDFRLKGTGGSCAGLVAAEAAGSLSGFDLGFMKCLAAEEGQIFHATALLHGYQIRVGATRNCLDAGGGQQLLVYPCYDISAANANQVWRFEGGRLQWLRKGSPVDQGQCLEERLLEKKEEAIPAEEAFTLQTCARRAGQLLRREDMQGDGTFLFRDNHTRRCLASVRDHALGLTADCDQRWRWLQDREQVQHVSTGFCVDANDDLRPILYMCHEPRAQQKQRFEILDTPGWIRLRPSWGDNGRKRWFEKCLDWKKAEPTNLSLKECSAAQQMDLHWERWNAHVPLEWSLWEQAEKPKGPVLGGDAAPP